MAKAMFIRPGYVISAPTATRLLVEDVINDKDIRACTAVFSKFETNKMPKELALDLGSVRILTEPNAGGRSEESEAMSFEVLRCLFSASLSKTEMEITYFPYGSKKTDYSVDMFGQRVGVSVTRSWFGPNAGEFTEEQAEYLLRKKLEGIQWSTQNVLNDTFSRQLLHVWAPSQEACGILYKVFWQLPEDLRINSILILTASKGCDWIYYGAPRVDYCSIFGQMLTDSEASNTDSDGNCSDGSEGSEVSEGSDVSISDLKPAKCKRTQIQHKRSGRWKRRARR